MRTLAAVTLLAALTVTPTAHAGVGPTYGNPDHDTPSCVTRQEWGRLHADRDRPFYIYVKRNLFGRHSHYITWEQDGRDTAYGHQPCWAPRKVAKVKVRWVPQWRLYRVVDKAITRGIA